MSVTPDPHAGQPVLHAGRTPASSRVTVILVHGRGDSAAGILGLADELNVPDAAFLAPQAAGNTWYPYSFLSPLEKNEPYLTSALRTLGRVIDGVAQHGVDPERIVLVGFSQGACLTLEFVARNPRRYGGVAALSGGVIGPPGATRHDRGSLEATPVFIGCSDIDAHIPVERVRESGEIFRSLAARVDERIYPGMGHTINQDELIAVRNLLTHGWTIGS
jgi:predicted esterase